MKKFCRRIAIVSSLLITTSAHSKDLRALGMVEKCSVESKRAEPIWQVPHFLSDAWSKEFRRYANKDPFLPFLTDFYLRNSGIVRHTVSMSHIVNLLAGTFEDFSDKERTARLKGELRPLELGKTYSLEEYEIRQATTRKFQAEVIAPMLDNLYKVYVSSVLKREETEQVGTQKRKEEALKGIPEEKRADEHVYERAERQRRVIMDAIRKIRPITLVELGEIPPIIRGTDLPFSYRDGYLVKIRFKKDDLTVTVYPRMIRNQVLGVDEYFVDGMSRWKSYCEERAREATGTPNAALAQRVATDAANAYEGANRVHAAMASVSPETLYFLMDFFREVRFGDIPECQQVIREMNNAMDARLKGESSSKKNGREKLEIDDLAKNIVFYQDIYGSFTDVSAQRLVKSVTK